MSANPLDEISSLVSEAAKASEGVEGAAEVTENAAETVEAAANSIESESSLAEAVVDEAKVMDEDALKMMKPYSEEVKSELTPEEVQSFDKEIGEVDSEIVGAEEKLEGDIGGNQPEENIKQEKPEVLKGEVVPPEERVDFSKLDPETQEFAEETFGPEFSKPFTDEEWEKANSEFGGNFKEWFENKFSRAEQTQGSAKGEAGKGAPEIKVAPTEAAKAMEDQDARELMKLLLRIAVKISIKTSAIIARNIAKSLAKDDPELAAAIGVFADLAEEGGKLGDTLIAGKKGTSVGEAIVEYMNKRKERKASAN
jgi:hypothetical protein